MAFWSKKKPTLHTNAPRHWPAVELDDFDNPGVSTIIIGGELAALNKPPDTTIAFLRDFVYDDGILRVPIVIEEGAQKTCVFVYSTHDEDAAAHYSAARTLLRARENANAVYYGPAALAPAKPGTVLQAIDTPFFSKADPNDDETFALWWATDETPKLTDSPEQTSIDRWFEAMDGYGFVLLTAFIKDLELTDEQNVVYALPSQPLLVPVTGPGDTRMLLHASAQEGLFLAFETSTAPSRRRTILRLLGDFAVDFRRAIEARGLPARDEEKGPGLACWRAMRDAGIAKEASGGAGLMLHAVLVREGQPVRSPQATTASERASVPQGLGREELDFGMDLVDRIVARLKKAPAAGSTQQELGAPNFSPVIAVKVGADLYEREVPYEDTPVAQAAAGRVLDEWPDAELVAVAADSAIRENGARVDVFSLKVQKRGATGSGELFQRYRVGDRGALELIGRPTASPEEGFLLEATASREPAPDDALTALARQALDTIVESLTFGEPSGMLGDDPAALLTAPSALLGVAGDARPHTTRFMMQGPLTAAMSCYATLQKEPAEWVAFHLDDLVSKNGVPDRRLRLCVQRRQDPRMAVFDQHFETPRKGKPFTKRGDLVFKRWGGSMFPPVA